MFCCKDFNMEASSNNPRTIVFPAREGGAPSRRVLAVGNATSTPYALKFISSSRVKVSRPVTAVLPGEATRLDVDFDAVGLRSEVYNVDNDASKQWLWIYAMPVSADSLEKANIWLLRDEVDDRHLVTQLAIRASNTIFSAPETVVHVPGTALVFVAHDKAVARVSQAAVGTPRLIEDGSFKKKDEDLQARRQAWRSHGRTVACPNPAPSFNSPAIFSTGLCRR